MASNQSSSIYSSHHNVMQIRERKVIPGTPPGIHFIPTDEELIEHYVRPYNLCPDEFSLPNGITIPRADVYTSQPTELPRNFQYGIGDEFYCFTQWKPKDKRQSCINRQVGHISWKTNDKESKISCVGFKKTFSFSELNPEGKETRWIVHEFSQYSSSRKNGKLKFGHYVLCRIKPPSSYNFIEDMISELTLPSMLIEEEIATTSNSNEIIRGKEDISGGFMDENYQPPVPSLHQSNNLYNSTTAMAVEQGVEDFYKSLEELNYQQPYSSTQWEEVDSWGEMSFSAQPHHQ